MGKSVRSAKVEAADFYIGDAYTGEDGAEAASYIDMGLTGGGSRIVQELDTVPHRSEQLRGKYGVTVSEKRYFMRVNMHQMNIWTFALGWGYANSDVVSSSALILDHADIQYRSARLAVNTTKDTPDGTSGARYFTLWRVAQVGNAEVNLSVEEMAEMPLELEGYLDANGIFGDMRQVKTENKPA